MKTKAKNNNFSRRYSLSKKSWFGEIRRKPCKIMQNRGISPKSWKITKIRFCLALVPREEMFIRLQNVAKQQFLDSSQTPENFRWIGTQTKKLVWGVRLVHSLAENILHLRIHVDIIIYYDFFMLFRYFQANFETGCTPHRGISKGCFGMTKGITLILLKG